MKIAMPIETGFVNPHFGHSREFVIFETEGGGITGKKIIANEGLDHNHDALAGLLKNQGVNVIIAGGIGAPMIKAFGYKGFKVITGAFGEVGKVAEDYLNGRLVTRPTQVCGCGGHGH